MNLCRALHVQPLLWLCGIPAVALAQVPDAGFIPKHNQFDPKVMYAAYSFAEADVAALRVDFWGDAWGGGGSAGWYIADGVDDGPQVAAVLLHELAEHSNCVGLECIGVQLQLGASYTRQGDRDVWEAPLTAGFIQRFSLPASALPPGLVGHLWGSASIIGQVRPAGERLGWGLGGGVRATFHGSLAPWGLHVFLGRRWFSGDGRGSLEVGVHRVLKAI